MYFMNWLFGKNGALFQASVCGKLSLVEELLNDGANVNATSCNGYTPLHRAAENGHIKVVKLLLDRGANSSAKTQKGITAMDIVLTNGHMQIAPLLQKPTQ